MDKSMITIIVACITGGVTVLGWNVSHYFARRRDDRTRRIESTISQLDRQLEEFYGPLHSLIEQIFNVWRVRKSLLHGVSENKRGELDRFIWKEYFQPLHTEIKDLLKTKLYLCEGTTIPQSFRDYLEHSTQELFQHRVATELNIHTQNVKAKHWPSQFDEDVKSAITKIMKRRDFLLRDLEPN